MATLLDTLTGVNWVTLALGPFVGTAFAFYFNRLLEAGKRHRERVAAANLALFALKHQYNDFLLYRKGYRETVGRTGLSGTEPYWAILKPSHMSFGNYAVDIKGISFLFERPGRAEVFDFVEEAQMSYRDMVSLAGVANQCAQKIQERAVKEERVRPGITLAQLELEIGEDLVSQMSMAVVGLGVRLERNEAVYFKAFNVLRNVWSPNGGVTLVRMREVEPKFRLGALPPLPKALADAVATMPED
jgi:hypothetical protein